MTRGKDISASPPLTNTALRHDRLFHWILAVIATAMAGGTGWGNRGQYGHETRVCWASSIPT